MCIRDRCTHVAILTTACDNQAWGPLPGAQVCPPRWFTRLALYGGAGRHQRPWALGLGGGGQVQQQLLGVVSGGHLHADRQAVELFDRDRHRRVCLLYTSRCV